MNALKLMIPVQFHPLKKIELHYTQSHPNRSFFYQIFPSCAFVFYVLSLYTNCIGTGESDWVDGTSEKNQENGFERGVELFVLELGKLKRKIQSVTKKKSSEILKSVAQEIHLQLQNVQSQTYTNMGKLTSHSNSKRKRLETRFEDQQKQLRLIHEKFKEELNQHLYDCRSTVEGLEAHMIEFKGTLEKQRVSHRKLLSQLEEATEIQLNDAQKKITDIHELARGKMLQLKHVISLCLKEGDTS